MAETRTFGSLERLWRYYQAGIVNTLFGYGLYAAFVVVGLNMYVAQIIAHTLGVAFNYFSYSRHTFADSTASKGRFVFSYALNYVLGLAALWCASQFIGSPYVAGLIAVVVVSLLNFFILNHFVFSRKFS